MSQFSDGSLFLFLRGLKAAKRKPVQQYFVALFILQKFFEVLDFG
jgi:hypothetical protein